MTWPFSFLTSTLGIQPFLILLQAPTVSGTARHPPMGVWHLPLGQPGPLPSRYCHGSLWPPSLRNLAWPPLTTPYLPSLLYVLSPWSTSPCKYFTLFIVCPPPAECELHEVQASVLSTAAETPRPQRCLTHDWFPVNAGSLPHAFLFLALPKARRITFWERSVKVHLLEGQFPLKGKSKCKIVTGFSSIWTSGDDKELSSCEVNHQRVWSLTSGTSTPIPKDVIQGHCGNKRKLTNHII